jgi:hypothetical protein
MGWTGSYVRRVYVRYISDEVGKDPQGVAIMHHEILRLYVTWYSLHRNLILLQLRRTPTWHLNGLSVSICEPCHFYIVVTCHFSRNKV